VYLDPMLPPQLGRGVVLKGLHWQGRTFDVSVGPDNTTVSATAGQPFAVESPQGTQLVSGGSPLILMTRRPDLIPTDNLAQCRPAQASSEEAGMYAEAAVDGSVATFWAPDDASGSVRVDLGRKLNIARILLRWTDASPSTYQVLVSANGTAWGAGAARRPRRDAPTPGQRPLCPRRPHPGGQRRDHRRPRAGGGPVREVTRAGATAWAASTITPRHASPASAIAAVSSAWYCASSRFSCTFLGNRRKTSAAPSRIATIPAV
jgi:hypothetical protein